MDKVKKKHKWDTNNFCVHCGIQRKLVMNKFGSYIANYMINYKWIEDRPDCKSKS
jgi:hypothetical protein